MVLCQGSVCPVLTAGEYCNKHLITISEHARKENSYPVLPGRSLITLSPKSGHFHMFLGSSHLIEATSQFYKMQPTQSVEQMT